MWRRLYRVNVLLSSGCRFCTRNKLTKRSTRLLTVLSVKTKQLVIFSETDFYIVYR